MCVLTSEYGQSFRTCADIYLLLRRELGTSFTETIYINAPDVPCLDGGHIH